MAADQLATAGGGRDVCGLCGNRCQGALCHRCRPLIDREAAELRPVRRG